jgi:hypothetical protein
MRHLERSFINWDLSLLRLSNFPDFFVQSMNADQKQNLTDEGQNLSLCFFIAVLFNWIFSYRPIGICFAIV